MKKVVKGVLATIGMATILAASSLTSCSTNKIWVISEMGYEEDDEYQVEATAERDEKGKIIVEDNTIKLLSCDEDSVEEDTYALLQYDENGHRVREMVVSDGVYVVDNKYTYNEKGEKIAANLWNNGNIAYSYENEYDENGNLIKTFASRAENGKTYTVGVQYSYYVFNDKNRTITIQNESGTTIGNGTYTYNVDGGYTLSGTISVSYSYSSSKGYTVSCSQGEKEYSVSGQLVRDASTYNEICYAYDEYGNMTEETTYYINNGSKELTSKVIYKYESVKVKKA